MNNKKIFIITIIFIIFIIFILGIIVISISNVENNKKIDASKSQVSSASKLEKMNDSELADFYYKINKNNDFVSKNIEEYRFLYKNADSVKDALEKSKDVGLTNKDKLLELKLQEETDYYYVIYQEYVVYRPTGEGVTFNNSFFFFKKSIFDIENKIINLNILNNKDKVKEIFNIYTYIKNRDNKGTKLLLSEIKNNSNEYIYTYYYFETTFGDWGLSDEISLYKSTITINKNTGKYDSTNDLIRQVKGRSN